MRYPDFLKEGGTIGFAAPSFGCNIDPYKSAFDNALKRFKEWGYKTELGPNCYAGEGLGISNTPEKCAAELSEMYASADNDVLITCGGGELMCEILPFMDWEKLKQADPKWVMGYSDITNFTFLSTTLLDTAAIYGPCASSFGMEPLSESLEDAFRLLCGKMPEVHNYPKWEKEGFKDEEHPYEPYNLTEDYKQRVFIPETGSTDAVGVNNGVREIAQAAAAEISFKGRLIGGCVDCLVNLCGTRYDKTAEFLERYKDDGFICSLNAATIILWI